jgi:hypothetical protein
MVDVEGSSRIRMPGRWNEVSNRLLERETYICLVVGTQYIVPYNFLGAQERWSTNDRHVDQHAVPSIAAIVIVVQ